MSRMVDSHVPQRNPSRLSRMIDPVLLETHNFRENVELPALDDGLGKQDSTDHKKRSKKDDVPPMVPEKSDPRGGSVPVNIARYTSKSLTNGGDGSVNRHHNHSHHHHSTHRVHGGATDDSSNRRAHSVSNSLQLSSLQISSPIDIVKNFEEKFELNLTLGSSLNNNINIILHLVTSSNNFYDSICNGLNAFRFCCLSRQNHATLSTIGLFICDIEQLFSILDYFVLLTKDQEEIFSEQLISIKNETNRTKKIVNKMLKYSIIPEIDPSFIKSDVTKLVESAARIVLESLSYIIQRLVLFVLNKKSNNLLESFVKVLDKCVINRSSKFEISGILETWLKENDVCTKCSRSIGTESCVQERHSGKKWHLNCLNCHSCNSKLFKERLQFAMLDNDGVSIICSRCRRIDLLSQEAMNKDTEDIETKLWTNRRSEFDRLSGRKQLLSVLKMNIIKTVEELESNDFGYICQEWFMYWKMDLDDLNKYDKNTQKIQSAIFELIHRQQDYVDSARLFLLIGKKYLKESKERPNELDPKLYDLMFEPVVELKKIHEKLLLTPMKRFLYTQGMLIKNQIFKLYLTWINKSYHAYDHYLSSLATSELLQDLDKMKPVSYLQSWIRDQQSVRFEKLLSGGFYYHLIQTKEILKNLEKVMERNDENKIVFQTSMLIDKFTFQLHSVLDRAVTHAYITRITNLEVKRTDVQYKKHAFVKYKSKITNEVIDCCIILLNMCLIITKLSLEDGTFVKFAPLIYTDNISYERADNKLLILDKSKKDVESYKLHFSDESEAIGWVEFN